MDPQFEQLLQELTSRLQIIEAEKTDCLNRIKEIDNELLTIKSEIKKYSFPTAKVDPDHDGINNQSTIEKKITLFRSLFRGREDVYPVYWVNKKKNASGYKPARSNEWGCRTCKLANIKPKDCPHKTYIPLDDKVIYNHLAGVKDYWGNPFSIGVYTLLPDDTCWFLAADFDKKTWINDVDAFVKTCVKKSVPAYIERSRSGNGAHVWIFFSEPIPAVEARKMGSYLITETMDSYPEIGFESYDRFFPNQDTMPAGGFGNLIALPLQKIPRTQGNSVFLDSSFSPHKDQWTFLESVKKMTPQQVALLAKEGSSRGRIVGLKLPLENDTEDPWASPPSRKRSDNLTKQLDSKSIEIVLGNQVYIPKEDLSSRLINRLIRIAAFQNPQFYKAQAMRFPTFDIPRVIACAENFSKHIALPRGCLQEIVGFLEEAGGKVSIKDERSTGKPIKTKFLGKLKREQKEAAKALKKEDTGVLAATTAFGKTVVAAHMIAKRRRNTLILVHRKQLMEQWIARLETFLDMTNLKIGHVGGGKRKLTGCIDVALIQSVIRKGEVDDLVANYGHVIIDECHHISAVSFESVVKECKARYILGLTATAIRKDGHHPIIFMQCGPIRYKVDAKKQALERPFHHHIVQRFTNFQMDTPHGHEEKISINTFYSNLTNDKQRNDQICQDVILALEKGRTPLILTERKEHLHSLAKQLEPFVKHIIILHGGMKAKERKEEMKKLAEVPDDEERLLISTGRYLGEGFDDARLDTLFLTMPISWKGTLAQYTGRLHRNHHAKKEVWIYDYVDSNIPMLLRMSEKRMNGYRAIGYEIKDPQDIDQTPA